MPETPAAPLPYRLKFFADSAFANEVKAAAKGDPDRIAIESEHEEREGTRLGFSFETVVAIVAVVKGVIEIGELAKKIYDWYTKSKSNVVVLQTPFGTLEMRKANKITEEDVRKFLQAATRITR